MTIGELVHSIVDGCMAMTCLKGCWDLYRLVNSAAVEDNDAVAAISGIGGQRVPVLARRAVGRNQDIGLRSVA